MSTNATVEQLRRRAGDQPELAITRELQTGHWLMETHPETIADVVLERINTRVDESAA